MEAEQAASRLRQRRLGVPQDVSPASNPGASGVGAPVDDKHKDAEFKPIATVASPWYIGIVHRLGVTFGVLLLAIGVSMFFSRSYDDLAVILNRSEVKCQIEMSGERICVQTESLLGVGPVPLAFSIDSTPGMQYHTNGNIYIGNVKNGTASINEDSSYLLLTQHGTSFIHMKDKEVLSFFPFLVPNKAPWLSMQIPMIPVIPPYRGVLPGYILRNDLFIGARGYSLYTDVLSSKRNLKGPSRLASYNQLAHEFYYASLTQSINTDSMFNMPQYCPWSDGSNRIMLQPEMKVHTQWIYNKDTEEMVSKIWPKHPYTFTYEVESVLSNTLDVTNDKEQHICIVIPVNQVIPGRLLWTHLYIKQNEQDSHMQFARICLTGELQFLKDGDYNEILQTHLYTTIEKNALDTEGEVEDMYKLDSYTTPYTHEYDVKRPLFVNVTQMKHAILGSHVKLHKIRSIMIVEGKKTMQRQVQFQTHHIPTDGEVFQHVQGYLSDLPQSEWICTPSKCLAPSISMKEQGIPARVIYDELYRLQHIFHVADTEREMVKAQTPDLFHFRHTNIE